LFDIALDLASIVLDILDQLVLLLDHRRQLYRNENKNISIGQSPDQSTGVFFFLMWIERIATDVVEHFHQLGDRLFDPLDVFVSFFDFIERGSRVPVSIRGHQLDWIGMGSTQLIQMPGLGISTEYRGGNRKYLTACEKIWPPSSLSTACRISSGVASGLTIRY
jgi:hypothetical protein